ncbi:HSP90-like protein [Citrus virus B]|nr:HSP90-like protein [Citrus virus B]
MESNYLMYTGEFSRIFSYYLGKRNSLAEFSETRDFILNHIDLCNSKTYFLYTPVRAQLNINFSDNNGVVNISSVSRMAACAVLMIYFEHINLGHLKTAYSLSEELSQYYNGDYNEEAVRFSLDQDLDKLAKKDPNVGLNFSRHQFNTGNFYTDVIEFTISNSLGRRVKMHEVNTEVFNPPLITPELPEEIYKHEHELIINCVILCRKHLMVNSNPALKYSVNRKINYFRELQEFVTAWVLGTSKNFLYSCSYSGMLKEAFGMEDSIRSFDDYVHYMFAVISTLNKYFFIIFRKNIVLSTKEVLILAKRNNHFNPLTTNRYLNLVMDTDNIKANKPIPAILSDSDLETILTASFDLFPKYCYNGMINDENQIFLCLLYLYALYSTSYPTNETINDVFISGFDTINCNFRFSDFNDDFRSNLAESLNKHGNKNIVRMFCGFFSGYAFKLFKKHNLVLNMFPKLNVPGYMRFDYIKYIDKSGLNSYEIRCLENICYQIRNEY